MTAPPPTGTDTAVMGRRLMDDFTKGWSKADLDLILSVFAEQAVFYETPFTTPHTGIDAIRRYWADVPYHQAEITSTSGEIYVAGPWFATEFKSVFRRRRTGEWVEARGAIFCETEGGKITEMRMYWHRQG
jgi:ketosteroid isomerase-like protein